jgi:hypothetical protein
MKIRDEIARKYWEQAAVEETRVQYLEQGYVVETHALLGQHTADLVARRGKEIVVAEFKSGPWSPEKEHAAAALRSYSVHTLGAQFVMVWAPPPVERTIEVDGLEKKLCNYLMENFPSELDEISTHTQIEEVSDVSVSSIVLGPSTTEIRGTALVGVQLVYGSESDRENDSGAEMDDSFPFQFSLTLNEDREIGEVEELTVDTSDFYGDDEERK